MVVNDADVDAAVRGNDAVIERGRQRGKRVKGLGPEGGVSGNRERAEEVGPLPADVQAEPPQPAPQRPGYAAEAQGAFEIPACVERHLLKLAEHAVQLGQRHALRSFDAAEEDNLLTLVV